jgi:hypothetical protein
VNRLVLFPALTALLLVTLAVPAAAAGTGDPDPRSDQSGPMLAGQAQAADSGQALATKPEAG